MRVGRVSARARVAQEHVLPCPPECQGGRETGRATADDDDVVRHAASLFFVESAGRQWQHPPKLVQEPIDVGGLKLVLWHLGDEKSSPVQREQAMSQPMRFDDAHSE